MKILVTGGASGLGAAITAKFAGDASNTVLITYSRSAAQAEAMKQKWPNVRAVACDFTNESQVLALAEEVSTFAPDVLINNAMAGAFSKQYFQASETAVFTDGFQHNILPVIIITQAAIKVFRKRKSGKIITVLSSAILNKPPIGWSAYVAEKNYLLSLSKSWATENARFNVTANTVSPSFMETDLNADVDERIVETIRNEHPLKQLLKPEEVADAIAFLASATNQLNGVNLTVNAAENIA